MFLAGELTAPGGVFFVTGYAVSALDGLRQRKTLFFPVSFESEPVPPPLHSRFGTGQQQEPPQQPVPIPIRPQIRPQDPCRECWTQYGEDTELAFDRFDGRKQEAERRAQAARDAAGDAYRAAVESAKAG